MLQKNGVVKTSPLLERPPLPEPLIQTRSDQTEDYLLEIGSEELPASFVSIGSQNLKKEMKALLEKEKLSFENIEVYATPRRLAVYVKGLAMAKPPKTIERKGTPIHNPQSSKDLKILRVGLFPFSLVTPLNCHHVCKENRKTQSLFQCIACSYTARGLCGC